MFDCRVSDSSAPNCGERDTVAGRASGVLENVNTSSTNTNLNTCHWLEQRLVWLEGSGGRVVGQAGAGHRMTAVKLVARAECSFSEHDANSELEWQCVWAWGDAGPGWARQCHSDVGYTFRAGT